MAVRPRLGWLAALAMKAPRLSLPALPGAYPPPPIPCQQTRTIVHLPILGGLAKVASAFALKKLAVVTLVRKYGVRNAFRKLHEMNEAVLGEEAAKAVSNSDAVRAFKALDEGLTSLEKQVAGLTEAEQTRAIWQWLQTVETRYPSFATKVVMSIAEGTTPYKWARTLMSDVPPTPPEQQEQQQPLQETAGRAEAFVDQETHERLVEKILQTNPDLRDQFDIILVPRSAPNAQIITEQEK